MKRSGWVCNNTFFTTGSSVSADFTRRAEVLSVCRVRRSGLFQGRERAALAAPDGISVHICDAEPVRSFPASPAFPHPRLR